MANPPKSRGVTIAPGVRYYGPAVLRPSTKYKRGGVRRDLYDPSKFVDLTKVKGTPPQAALRQEFQGVQGVPGAGMKGVGLPQEGLPQQLSQQFIQEAGDQQPTQLPTDQAQPQVTKTGSWMQDLKNWWAERTSRGGEFRSPFGGEVRDIETDVQAIIGNIAFAGTLAATAYYGLTAIGLGAATTSTGLKVTTKSAALYRSTGQITANTATTNSVITSLAKSGVLKTGLILYLIKEAQSDIVFGKFQLVEGLDKLGIARTNLIKNGLGETPIGLEISAAIDNYTEAMNWYRMNIPILGSKIGTDKNIKAAELTKKAWDLISQHQKESVESGVDEWTIYQREKDANEKENIRLYEESRIRIIELEKQARKEGDIEAAHIFEESAMRIEKIKEENAERNRQFWLEYLRLKKKLMEETGRSTLGFGLL